jgi:tRNA threonylcarbamoyladenosine biosynthesis protein TsaB
MILAINTSTLQFSLALSRMDGDLLAECTLSTPHKHFGGLFATLDFLLDLSRKGPADIRAVAVATGPGSFTGLRVGLSMAKGICHGLHLPLIGISTLEALANQLPCSNLPVTPVVDSRRGEVFVACFLWNAQAGSMDRIMEDRCVKFEQLPRICGEPSILIGNHFSKQAPILHDILRSQGVLAPEDKWHVRAATIAKLGLQRLRKGETDSLEHLSPQYFRPPDIRPNAPPLLERNMRN